MKTENNRWGALNTCCSRPAYRRAAVVATIAATAIWAFVSYLINAQITWLSAIAFVVPFAVIFGVIWWRRTPQSKG
jgi:CHASE2 domain-containing sensor protein